MKATIAILTGGITGLTCGLFATPSGDPITMIFCGGVGAVTSFLLLLLILARPSLKSLTASRQILFAGGVCLLTTLTMYAVILFVASRNLDSAMSNKVTGANSRYAGLLDCYRSHNAVVADARAVPAAVAQFRRSANDMM